MDEFVRKVYERGKVTIPKELRDLYGVKDGDMVKLRIVRVIDRLTEERRRERGPGPETAEAEHVGDERTNGRHPRTE